MDGRDYFAKVMDMVGNSLSPKVECEHRKGTEGPDYCEFGGVCLRESGTHCQIPVDEAMDDAMADNHYHDHIEHEK